MPFAPIQMTANDHEWLRDHLLIGDRLGLLHFYYESIMAMVGNANTDTVRLLASAVDRTMDVLEVFLKCKAIRTSSGPRIICGPLEAPKPGGCVLLAGSNGNAAAVEINDWSDPPKMPAGASSHLLWLVFCQALEDSNAHLLVGSTKARFAADIGIRPLRRLLAKLHRSGLVPGIICLGYREGRTVAGCAGVFALPPTLDQQKTHFQRPDAPRDDRPRGECPYCAASILQPAAFPVRTGVAISACPLCAQVLWVQADRWARCPDDQLARIRDTAPEDYEALMDMLAEVRMTDRSEI